MLCFEVAVKAAHADLRCRRWYDTWCIDAMRVALKMPLGTPCRRRCHYLDRTTVVTWLTELVLSVVALCASLFKLNAV
jgi:hypothetical protein